MYYPIQIPYILNHEYSNRMVYREYQQDGCEDFVICFWEMTPKSDEAFSVSNIIVTDACIDVVVDYDNKRIGFAGMSQTDFCFEIELPTRSFGARLKPGVFRALTGLDAAVAMDTYLEFQDVYIDFEENYFFDLSFELAQKFLGDFISKKFFEIEAKPLIGLFDELFENIPLSVAELGKILHLSPRQIQRVFAKNFGITPKVALSILRFQKCLGILTSPMAKPSDALSISLYYDQPHFNNDFKRNLGITPVEFIDAYKK